MTKILHALPLSSEPGCRSLLQPERARGPGGGAAPVERRNRADWRHRAGWRRDPDPSGTACNVGPARPDRPPRRTIDGAPPRSAVGVAPYLLRRPQKVEGDCGQGRLTGRILWTFGRCRSSGRRDRPENGRLGDTRWATSWA